MFAAIVMIMVGIFQALQGLIAIFENEFYVAARNYLFQFDATTWGWIHLSLGPEHRRSECARGGEAQVAVVALHHDSPADVQPQAGALPTGLVV
jgi:hypothetical protein